MKSKILKSGMLAVILIIFLIFIASGVNAANNANDEASVLTMSKGGLSISYPSDWGVADSNSQYSIMSITKLKSIDSAGIGQVNINFEKKPLDEDFNKFLETTYKSMESDSSFELVSSGQSVIGDREAQEYIYISNQDGVEKEHKAVWFEKGGQAYVLLYSAPLDQFESNLYVFDYILTDIQIN